MLPVSALPLLLMSLSMFEEYSATSFANRLTITFGGILSVVGEVGGFGDICDVGKNDEVGDFDDAGHVRVVVDSG